MNRHLLLLPLIFIATFASAKDACPTPKRESPLACDRAALSPAVRKRHFEELGPALRARRIAVRELPAGYEFEFPSDTATLAMITEWVSQERLCCPFFDIDVHVTRERGPLLLRLSGRGGTKDVIRASDWVR